MNENKQDLVIEGMHCASCSQSVERALKAVPGVEQASVNLLGENAVVIHDGSVPLETLRQAVTNAGFRADAPKTSQTHHLGVDGMTCAGCVASVADP